ncbi:MAG: hypothetical protein VB032_02405 [Burkholderiaceae bacterium]|nr:hypothetical protein [Burkholderiaceae bacterium]
MYTRHFYRKWRSGWQAVGAYGERNRVLQVLKNKDILLKQSGKKRFPAGRQFPVLLSAGNVAARQLYSRKKGKES